MRLITNMIRGEYISEQKDEAQSIHLFFVNLPLYLSMYVCTYVCIYLSIYVCIYLSFNACMYVCMYVCVYVYMYVCIYLSRHISIHSLIQLNVLFLPRDAPHLSGSSVGRKTSWSTFPPWGRVRVRDIERQCERERQSKRERERERE